MARQEQLSLPGLWRWQRTCKIPGCPRPILARNYCRNHYAQWHRHGSPTSEPNPHLAKLAERNRAVRQGRVPYEDREWLRSRYESGLTFREIADEAGCGLRTIARWFHQHGLETRPLGSKRSGIRPSRRKPCACGKPKSPGTKTKQCWECRNKSYRGAGAPNWQGIADVMRLLRQHIADHWRPTIFERDGYRCRLCGDNRGHNLNAHHIAPLSVLVRSKREAWSPDVTTAEGRMAFLDRLRGDSEVMDTANGVTLCEDCHRTTHRGQGTYAYAAVRGRRQHSDRAKRGHDVAGGTDRGRV